MKQQSRRRTKDDIFGDIFFHKLSFPTPSVAISDDLGWSNCQCNRLYNSHGLTGGGSLCFRPVRDWISFKLGTMWKEIFHHVNGIISRASSWPPSASEEQFRKRSHFQGATSTASFVTENAVRGMINACIWLLSVK